LATKKVKAKSNRGAAKRFKLTKSGKIKRGKAFRSHILTSKSTKRKRNLRAPGYVCESDVKKVRAMVAGC